MNNSKLYPPSQAALMLYSSHPQTQYEHLRYTRKMTLLSTLLSHRSHAQTSRPLPGLNLGGWLVLEKWMTPSVFAGTEAINEYELWQTAAGPRHITHHHSTFITEADIRWVAATGVRLLRVPIGYWALEDQPPYQNCRKHLDWLLEAAQRYNLRVLLCLHAAPGAQNANDHSGSGQPGTTGWFTKDNQQRTTFALQQLAKRYGNHPALWGIELLNEPLVHGLRHSWQFWRWSRTTKKLLAKTLPPHVRIVISDAYNPAWWSGKFGRNCALDIHHYHCFAPADQAATDITHHHAKLVGSQVSYAAHARQQPIIIGEWSATLPQHLMSDKSARAFCAEQLTTFTSAEAWFFWSYKTESPDSWNFRHLYAQGYFTGILPRSSLPDSDQ